MEEFEIIAKEYGRNIDVSFKIQNTSMLSIFQKYRYIDVDIDVSPNTDLEQ